MSSFHCPFCNVDMPVTPATHAVHYPSFESSNGTYWYGNSLKYYESSIAIDFLKCPKCNNYSIFATECGSYTRGLNVPLIPKSHAKKFPLYVPEAIRQDYEESYSIVNLSPKASATLSRRCLQGMIRDFWKINKSNLAEAINELQNKVTSSQWKAIDSIRSIGNIGAHMEKDINVIIDVDPDEAEKLLKLIELLVDKWYISRHDEEELLNDITNIAENKKLQKSSK